MLHLGLALLALCLPWSEVRAYPSGAPTERCTDMQPSVYSHGPAQNSEAPYSLTVKSSGDKFNVTLDSETVDFRGLLLQVRQKDTTTIVGSFAVAPANFQLINCDGENSAVTHSNRNDKGKPKTFTWTPPKDAAGEMEVVATIVQTKSMYWTQVKSKPFMTHSEDTPTPEPESPTPEPESPTPERTTDNAWRTNRPYPPVSGATTLVPLLMTYIMVLLTLILY